MQVIRIWKRDGSFNVMSLNAAAKNLRTNGHSDDEEVIAECLKRGHMFETRHAIFGLTKRQVASARLQTSVAA